VRLTPGERKLLGKRGADAVEANGLALVSAAELERLRKLDQVDLDKRSYERQIGSLLSQVVEAKQENSRLQDEVREANRVYLEARRGHCVMCAYPRERWPEHWRLENAAREFAQRESEHADRVAQYGPEIHPGDLPAARERLLAAARALSRRRA